MKRVQHRIKQLRLGPSQVDNTCADVGAMITDARFDRLESIIQAAVNKGAKLLAGGKRYNHPHYPNGHYFEP